LLKPYKQRAKAYWDNAMQLIDQLDRLLEKEKPTCLLVVVLIMKINK